MRPLALTVVGGLLTAMLLTLYLVPCLYLVVQSMVDALKRLQVRTDPTHAACADDQAAIPGR